jgi:histone H2B
MATQTKTPKPRGRPPKATKERSQEDGGDKKKKAGGKKTKKEINFVSGVYKVCRHISPDATFSKTGMMVMDHFCKDMFDKIAEEAQRLVAYRGKKTMTSNDIMGAVRLILPGELADHAITEGTNALNAIATQE